MLQRAKALGDTLVVVLSSDAHNRKPYAVPAATRRHWMEDLGIADKVVVGKPRSFAETLRQEKPDILVLGYDQKLPDEETERVAAELGVEVIVMPWFPGKDDVVCSL